MRGEQRANGGKRVRGNLSSGTGEPIEYFGPWPLAAHDRDRIGREEGIPSQRSFRGAVEKQTVRQPGEPLAAARRVGRWHELLDEREHAIVSHRNGSNR